MGYHWASDVKVGKNLTYEMANLVPVLPMYSDDKKIVGIFFAAVGWRQTGYPPKCLPFTNPTYSSVNVTKCFVEELNFWDSFPLSLDNNFEMGANIFCTNFCGECNFTNSFDDGWGSTMHFLFKDTISEYNQGKYQCTQKDDYGSCRNEPRYYLGETELL